MVLDDLAAATDRLYEEGPDAYASGPALEELLALQARLGAFVARAVACFDARGGWSLSGARSATAWLTAQARLSTKEARAQLRRGRALGHLPETAMAWERGELTGDHVDVLTPLGGGRTAEALRRDERLLVDQGCRLTHHQFVRAVGYWRQLADPCGTEEDAGEGTAGRDA